MRADIARGGIFPDYQLTDHTRTPRRLSVLQGDDPMILVLSRGHFCPKDHQQHLQLAAFYPQVVAGYTQIVTIATDDVFTINDFRAGLVGLGRPDDRARDLARVLRRVLVG